MALHEAPQGLDSLRTLLAHCGADGAKPQTPAPPPATAESLFIETEAKRLQQPGGRQALSLVHIHRETPGDRAAVDAAAAIGLKDNRAALRREVAAQAQRQTSAECRRRWKLLTSHQRREWERSANDLVRQGRQRQSVAASTATVAARLLTAVDDEHVRSRLVAVLREI